jgi:hypothetical protein
MFGLPLPLFPISHYQSDLLPRYEPVPSGVSVGYVQTISNDVTQAFARHI